MNSLKPIEADYWNAYVSMLPENKRPNIPRITAGHAGTPAITDRLLDLYFQGRKTAGSSVLEDFVSCGDPIPKVGDYWIFLDSSTNPRCILRTERISLNKFFEVPVEVALAEGEGDLSLKYWREVHAELYETQLKQWGVSNLAEATVITEYFSMVYRNP